MTVVVAMDDADLEREQLWPMGAVTRRTGIGEHTLRAWERRFGFPDPVRLPSGHRRYPLEQVRRLALINTGDHILDGYRAYARGNAERFGLRYEEIPGSNALVEQMVYGPWGANFVVAEPGRAIEYLDFRAERAATGE